VSLSGDILVGKWLNAICKEYLHSHFCTSLEEDEQWLNTHQNMSKKVAGISSSQGDESTASSGVSSSQGDKSAASSGVSSSQVDNSATLLGLERKNKVEARISDVDCSEHYRLAVQWRASQKRSEPHLTLMCPELCCDADSKMCVIE
jgi:hypothetical protein